MLYKNYSRISVNIDLLADILIFLEWSTETLVFEALIFIIWCSVFRVFPGFKNKGLLSKTFAYVILYNNNSFLLLLFVFSCFDFPCNYQNSRATRVTNIFYVITPIRRKFCGNSVKIRLFFPEKGTWKSNDPKIDVITRISTIWF